LQAIIAINNAEVGMLITFMGVSQPHLHVR